MRLGDIRPGDLIDATCYGCVGLVLITEIERTKEKDPALFVHGIKEGQPIQWTGFDWMEIDCLKLVSRRELM